MNQVDGLNSHLFYAYEVNFVIKQLPRPSIQTYFKALTNFRAITSYPLSDGCNPS